jgi:hypothetical protein
MKWIRPVQFLFTFLALSGCLFAQAWSGILDPTRATNWSGTGSGIVQPRSTICAAVSLTAGSSAASSNTTAINNAIASCPSGEVVFIPAGTWYVNYILDSNVSNITIRGAGPTQTTLLFQSSYNCAGEYADICLMQPNYYFPGSAWVQPGQSNAGTWSGGYSQGATSITLSSVGSAGITNGQPIILDQANDITGDTGGFVVCDQDTDWTCHQSSETSSGGRVIGGVDYSQQQVVTVTSGCSTACKGAGPFTVTISPGLRANNWRSSQTPGVFWGAWLTGVGVENMTLNHDASANEKAGIFFQNCNQCWVKNIRSINSNRNHVWLYESIQDVVRDSYFYGTQHGAEQSYGVELDTAFDSLIENNIFDHIVSPFMAGQGMAGDVVGYNYSMHSAYYLAPTFLLNVNSAHDSGAYMNLFEGNGFMRILADDVHGTTSGATTYFRNWFTGWDSGTTNEDVPIIVMAYARGYNVIGNVLGTVGWHTQYEASPGVGTSTEAVCSVTIYSLGWGGGYCDNEPNEGVSDDTIARSTLLRWGNYDVVNGSVQWNSSEVPTTGVPYINGNPVPSTHSLPSSFYLSGEPTAFWKTPWGTPPWPPNGPDVSAGSGPGGYANANPAQLCATNTGYDSNYQTTYSVTGASWSSGTATLTIGSNTLLGRDSVSVSAVSPSGYNGNFQLTGETSTTVSYPLAANPGTYSGGGSVAGPDILAFDGNSCYLAPAPAVPTNASAVGH